MNISVIIPIYNAEKYIERCVDSLLQQTMKDFEIVIVDDGSTDHTSDICEMYQEHDERIRVFHQKQSGVAVARNTGVGLARGEWIAFIDADDYVEEDYLQKLFQLVCDNQAQMSIVGAFDTDESSGRILGRSKTVIGTYNAENAIKMFLHHQGIICVMWGKLFAKSLFKNIFFSRENVVGEDLAVFYRLIDQCKCIAIDTSARYYHYMIHEHSLIHSCSLEERVKEINTIDSIIFFIHKKYPNLIDDAYYFKYAQLQGYLAVTRKIYSTEQEDIYKALKKQYLELHTYLKNQLKIKEKIKFWLYRLIPIQILKKIWR